MTLPITPRDVGSDPRARIVSLDVAPRLQESARQYLKIRERERRLFSDEEAARLPHASPANPHRAEFELRAKSVARLRRWLDRNLPAGRVLEIGCGNGWLLNQLIANSARNGVGLDINLPELEQATVVFRRTAIKWVYGDVLDPSFSPGYVDTVVLASAIQYFADIPMLIERIKAFLAPGGTVHVIDSPLYSEAGAAAAQSRSAAYYAAQGVPAMNDIYRHHPFSAFRGYEWSLAYDPCAVTNRLRRKIGLPVVPFPWILIAP